jgi:phage tail-like protein
MAASTYERGRLATDPIRNFRFLCTFLPLGTEKDGQMTPDPKIGFTSVSGLNISTESIPYREGQHNTTVRQIPGQTTFSPITFQRGVVLGSRQNWQWMEMLFRADDNSSRGALSAKTSFRFNVQIDVLAHPVRYASKNTGYDPGSAVGSNDPSVTDEKVAMRFRVFNAWPTSVAYSDLNAGDNALIVEQLTVVHEGFDVQWASVSEDGGFTPVNN